MRATSGERAEQARDANSDDNPAERAAKEFETNIVGEIACLQQTSHRHFRTVQVGFMKKNTHVLALCNRRPKHSGGYVSMLSRLVLK